MSTFRALVLVATLLFPVSATAADYLTIESDGRRIDAEVFAAKGPVARTAVIVLHGGGGLARDRDVYRRYAKTLATAGIEAILVPYYSAADATAMSSRERPVRQAVYHERLTAWMREISAVVDALARDGKSVGLLGFSQGGYLATAVAATDRRITALAVFYGGMPDALRGKVAHLPRSLILHGDEDRVVPFSEAQSLEAQVRMLGANAELAVYRGKGHGFDFDAADAAAADAMARIVRFFRSQPRAE